MNLDFLHGIALTPWHALGFFLMLVVLGEPLFVVIAGLALLCFLCLDPGNTHNPLDKLVQVVLSFATLSEQEPVIAIPLFTLAGTIMTHGGMSARLVAFARALAGWMPGGLGMACVAACTIFAAISGSSAVTIIAIGGLLYPALRKEKFSDNFSLGLITSCGAIGILIPPSLPLIIYGIVASNSVADGKLKPGIDALFNAGLIPSVLCVSALCAYCAVVATVKKIPPEKFSFRELAVRTKEGFFALLMVAILLVGIYRGYTTATEASAVACVYALIVETLIHRKIGPKKLVQIGRETIELCGVILIILVSALAFTNFLQLKKVPDQAIDIIYCDRVTVHNELFSDADFEKVDLPVFVVAERADGGISLRPFDSEKPALEVAKDGIGKRAKKDTLLVGRIQTIEQLRATAEKKPTNKDEELRAKAAAKLVAALGPDDVPFEFKDPTDWDGALYVALPKAAISARDEPLVHTQIGFLLVVNLLLLAVGSVMDIYSAIVVIAPLIVPIAAKFHVSLVHLGIIFVLNLELGLAHPPLGINLFIAQSYFKKSILQVTLAAIPFLLLLLGVLGAVTYWPELSLWLVAPDKRGIP